MDLQDKKLTELFRSYCDYAPQSANLTVQKCWNVFNEALFATFRTIFNGSGILINADTQFAWRCFTNDLTTPDIMGVFETQRPGNSNRFCETRSKRSVEVFRGKKLHTLPPPTDRDRYY